MRKLWEQSWGIYFKPEGAIIDGIKDCTTTYAWENGSVYLNFQNKPYSFSFGVYFFFTGLYGLYFLIEKSEDETSLVSHIQPFSSDWYINKKDGCWETQSTATIADMKHGIDLTQIQKNIHEAKKTLAAYYP